MQAVALIFALAVITGSNARVLPPPALQDVWVDSVNQFWQRISDLNQRADGVVQDLKASQLSRELDTLITDTMAELATYKDGIQTRMGALTEGTTGDVSQDLQLLFNKLHKDMMDAKERSQEYLLELKSLVETNQEDVHSRINSYTHKLKKRLNKDTEEIRNTASIYLGEIQARAVQNLENVREQVDPYVQQASETATKKLSDISSLLKTQADNLGQQLETQADAIKTQLEATAQDLRTSLEGKIDELTQLLTPYANKARQQVEGIVEAVKAASS